MQSKRVRPATLVLSALALPAAAQNIGPSTSVSPYVVPSRTGVTTTSILTVNDPTSTIDGYRMVGIPDGLGAFDGGNGKLVLLMNHELGAGSGIPRRTGFPGAFVSRWEIDRTTLTVTSGSDFNGSPADVTWVSQAPRAHDRYCSGDLALPSAYRFGSYGTDARIYLNGEESGNEGTAWAHVATGPGTHTSWELPALGRMSFENAVACPYRQYRTVVACTDDASPGQVYVYVGTKTSTGNDVTRAGLTNGTLFGVRVQGTALETRATPVQGTFDLAPLGSVVGMTGAALQTASNAANVTNFLRPEDACWDTRPGFENDLYMVTTDTVTSSGGRSRLYRLTFANIGNPELGGTITPLLNGTEGGEMNDNMCIDSLGRILLQEDVGGNARLGKIWLYDTTSGSFGEIAAHEPAFFQSGRPNFMTIDEESSGIIDATDLLGAGWFMLDVQAHRNLGGELVQDGQLLAMFVDPMIFHPVGMANFGRSSPGCRGLPAVGAQSVPRLGNAQFALSCSNAPQNASGLAAFSLGRLQSPIPLQGIELWIDPARPFILAFGVGSDAMGRGTFAMPIANDASQGLTLYSQFLWLGPTAPQPCPPLGFSASSVVGITIQP